MRERGNCPNTHKFDRHTADLLVAISTHVYYPVAATSRTRRQSPAAFRCPVSVIVDQRPPRRRPRCRTVRSIACHACCPEARLFDAPANQEPVPDRSRGHGADSFDGDGAGACTGRVDASTALAAGGLAFRYTADPGAPRSCRAGRADNLPHGAERAGSLADCGTARRTTDQSRCPAAGSFRFAACHPDASAAEQQRPASANQPGPSTHAGTRPGTGGTPADRHVHAIPGA